MMKVVFFIAILAFGADYINGLELPQIEWDGILQLFDCLKHIKSCQTPAELGKNYVFAFDRPFKEYCPIAQL